MNVLLGHIDFAPLMYGLVMFLGLMVMWWKLTHGRWLGLMIDIGVFALVFKLHGGTMQGDLIAEEFKKMVWIRDKDGKEYACTVDNLKNIRRAEDLSEEERTKCMDLSLVMGDSW